MRRPLAGVRVIDLVTGPMARTSRYLAELGADVVRPFPRGMPTDPYEELAANAGKRGLELTAEPAAIEALIGQFHVVLADRTIDLGEWRKDRPSLVSMTISNFGTGNSFSDWAATDPILHALSGELSRSGIRDQPPLLPPEGVGYQCAAAQAAYSIMVSLYHALRTGSGDHIDFSALEGAVQALDPGFGIGGSATMGKPAKLLSRNRPPRGFQYPILPCLDGRVRICLLAKRQWRGMFRWMGEPPAFADPAFDQTAVRYKSRELIPAIGEFFADKTQEWLVREGQRHGVPIAAVACLAEALDAEHFAARQMFCRSTMADGRETRLADGPIFIDGARMSVVAPPEQTGTVSYGQGASSTRAFDGLKVLDLGIIVVGAESSRLFADQGADVIKIESRDFPDGNRQSYLPYDLSVSFAAGHRNKRSLGIDLKNPRGRKLFLDMVAKSDIVLSNFKPGTLEALGLDTETLRRVNPAIITIKSSAFGESGPWSRQMGYGPLVRAATGLTDRWRYPEQAEGFSDSITIYPDHVAARVGAIAAIALLIRRLQTGLGGEADIAQAEVMLTHFGADLARAAAGEPLYQAPDRPWGIFPAKDDDGWCVVTSRDDNDWRAIAPLLGLEDDLSLGTRTGRLAQGNRLDEAMRAWVLERDAVEAMNLMQKEGVPAAAVLRVADLPTFGYFVERDFYRVEQHPYLEEEVVNERRHARARVLADADSRPAPLAGEQTREIARERLALSDTDTAELVDAGILQPTSERTYQLIGGWIASGTRRQRL